MTVPPRSQIGPIPVADAAAMPVADVIRRLDSADTGLGSEEAARRLATVGHNALRTHRANPWTVLFRQVRSPLLLLLTATAIASFFVGERTDAVIIGTILLVSVGLGFLNEYRAEQAAQALHDQISHRCVVRRDNHAVTIDVVDLVPGDVVELRMGEVVPADIRLTGAIDLECVESVLTGESMPTAKSIVQLPAGTPLAELTGCALMGTVVSQGSGSGIVVATGPSAAFGRIAVELGTRHPDTQFQVGLRDFSLLLVKVAGVLTAGIFVINVVLRRPIIDALLFSLAIAVGISPQLLPAVVSTSLAAGSRQLARRKVLVKRLVCIEDLGDIAVLFTDKTGTLTDGRIAFSHALDATGRESNDLVLLGLLCNEATVEAGKAVGGNPLDIALFDAPAAVPFAAELGRYRRAGILPFDHERRRVSVLVDTPERGRRLIVKGAPESLLPLCPRVPDAAKAAIDRAFADGNRVVAIASRDAAGESTVTADTEREMSLDGLLVFLDPPKPGAKAALQRLAALGITVKVVTGDNPTVAEHVCRELALESAGAVTGADIDAADDDQLRQLLDNTTVFARVSPEHKARIVRTERRSGRGVAFLGDGVNDALALHEADVGISVDTATDVAKDAADVILLEKDLDVLADGVVGGRRIFANTIKYVFMGTSSNFGNMFSAAGASAFLSFLPMLPSQILLNNLLYDTSQLAIPTDRVDEEQLARPSHWDAAAIRRFMLMFGPVSSVFDFVTFAVMLWVFHAHAHLFRTGWFVESLATQTLVIFAIRTRRIPFLRSRASQPLTASALGVVLIGLVVPFTPMAGPLGFRTLPVGFFLALALMVGAYLLLVEAVKRRYYRTAPPPPPPHVRRPPRSRATRVHRRAAKFSTSDT
ncbi:MAG TPA: magnesium-translocating P-type ATPase [Mycobacteriales bacterium]|nr:magnesium-translocating P-type ATPase [Mycobacteriales bacterium]